MEALDLETLFGIEEAPADGQKEKEKDKKPKPEKKASRAQRKTDSSPDTSKPSDETPEGENQLDNRKDNGSEELAGEGPVIVSGPSDKRTEDTRDSGGSEANHGGSPSTSQTVRPDGWNVNIIGEPDKRKRPNPWFEGVIARVDTDRTSTNISFKDIKSATRIIHVDDIHLQNPQVLSTRYTIVGTFIDVVANITEDMFNQILTHPECKLQKVFYSYVSCEREDRRRNYQLINNDQWPTPEFIKEQDKRLDGVDWALMGYGERKKQTEIRQAKGEEVPEFIEEPTTIVEEEESVPDTAEEIAEE